jgi:hypothetical protein
MNPKDNPLDRKSLSNLAFLRGTPLVHDDAHVSVHLWLTRFNGAEAIRGHQHVCEQCDRTAVTQARKHVVRVRDSQRLPSFLFASAVNGLDGADAVWEASLTLKHFHTDVLQQLAESIKGASRWIELLCCKRPGQWCWACEQTLGDGGRGTMGRQRVTRSTMRLSRMRPRLLLLNEPSEIF